MSTYKHRRTTSPTTAFPTLAAGEIALNIPNRQLAAGDAAGTPLSLLGVRFFDSHASYLEGDFVVSGGQLYRANTANGPGTFTEAQWDKFSAGDSGATLTVSDTAPIGKPPGSLWWESDSGILYVYYDDGDSQQWVQAAASTQDLSAYATVSYVDGAAVKYNTAQTLTAPQQAQARSNIGVSVLNNYLTGLTLSTPGSSVSFSVAAGYAADSSNADMMTLAATITKTQAAWTVGAGGALDTGAIANNTWYYVWLIKRPDTGIVDVLFSLSATAPTMPANYTLKRRIGALRTSTPNWWNFVQTGDKFMFASSTPLDLNNGAMNSASRNLVTLTIPPAIQVEALIRVTIAASAGVNTVFTSPQVYDGAAAASDAGNSIVLTSTGQTAGELRIPTSTGQIGARSSAAANCYINTYGWIDRRGRDG